MSHCAGELARAIAQRRTSGEIMTCLACLWPAEIGFECFKHTPKEFLSCHCPLTFCQASRSSRRTTPPPYPTHTHRAQQTGSAGRMHIVTTQHDNQHNEKFFLATCQTTATRKSLPPLELFPLAPLHTHTHTLFLVNIYAYAACANPSQNVSRQQRNQADDI